MADPMLGLDVGTSAVRVVQVGLGARGGGGSRPVIEVFGQVPLPAGAARDGEVVDPAAVGEAIAELWRETGLRQRDVRVGLASQRTVVRVVEFPAIPDAELAGAIRFSAQDHISMPLEEAVLDFIVLERFGSEGGSPGALGGPATLRVLLAAAHREPVDHLLEALAAGGLRAVGVDLVSFALVRALAGEADIVQSRTGEAPSVPEAIVSIGAGVTTVVIHEGGQPSFVRTVATGGQALTAAVAEELGLSLEAAEVAKRGVERDDLGSEAARVVGSRLGGLLGEVQNSINYWMAQSDRPLARVLLTGGGALLDNLPGRLSPLVGAPVEMARLRERFDVDAGPALGPETDPFLAVAAGLALGGVPSEFDRIDLNPAPPRPALLSRRVRLGIAGIAAALVLLLSVLSVARAMSAGRERDRLAAQERKNQGIEAAIQKLGGVSAASAQLETGRRRVQAVLTSDVEWTRLLTGLAGSMPEGVWLQSFNAQVTTPMAAPSTGVTTAPSASAPSGSLGTAAFTAAGLDYPSVASWLERLPREQAFSAVAVSSITTAALGSRSIVNFSSTAQLAPAARSARAEQLSKGTR